MADRTYDFNPGFVVPTFTRKADGAVGFGKLVEKGSAANDVKVTAADTAFVQGIAVPNEVIYRKSSTAEYADGDVVTVAALVPGKIYAMYSTTGIAEGAHGSCAAAGIIEPLTVGSATSYKVVGVAHTVIAATSWGKVLII